MKFQHFFLIMFVAAACGCDMKGDTNLKPESGGGGGQANGDNVIFACGNVSKCFSGTQYCLMTLNSTGVTTSSTCLNYPNDNCKNRDCLSRTVRDSNIACRDLIDFEQSQSQITLTCRDTR